MALWARQVRNGWRGCRRGGSLRHRRDTWHCHWSRHWQPPTWRRCPASRQTRWSPARTDRGVHARSAGPLQSLSINGQRAVCAVRVEARPPPFLPLEADYPVCACVRTRAPMGAWRGPHPATITSPPCVHASRVWIHRGRPRRRLRRTRTRWAPRGTPRARHRRRGPMAP